MGVNTFFTALIIISAIIITCFFICVIYFKNNRPQNEREVGNIELNQEEVGNIELRGVKIGLFPISTFPIEGDCDSECCICYDEFIDNDEIMILPVCRHIYHPHCVIPWLTSHSYCPLCRHDYSGYS